MPITVSETTAKYTSGTKSGQFKDLLLSKYVTSPEDGLETYYLDGQNVPHKLAAYTDYGVLYKTYNVILGEISDAEQLAAIRGKQLTIQAFALTEDPSHNNPWEDDYVETATGAIIQLVGSGETLNGYVANGDAAETGIAFSVPANFTSSAGGDVIAKIAVRVDGDESESTEENHLTGAQQVSSDKDASFYVSVSAPADTVNP